MVHAALHAVFVFDLVCDVGIAQAGNWVARASESLLVGMGVQVSFCP